jgi:hypothetical protein
VATAVDALGRQVQLAAAPGPQHDMLACVSFLSSMHACWLLADPGLDVDDRPIKG